MNSIIDMYVKLFKNTLTAIAKVTHRTDAEKYDDVCSYYASIMAKLSEETSINIKDTLPITKLFRDYQTNYFK